MDIEVMVSDALADFAQVAALARAEFLREKVIVQFTPKPHRAPSSLPIGRMAVYAFFHDMRVLKVGKVGPKSAARYVSQHYSGSAMSTLAGSILLNQAKVGASGLDSMSAGAWIKENTSRINLLLPTAFGMPVLSLLEAFLHVRWRPVFEGRAAE